MAILLLSRRRDPAAVVIAALTAAAAAATKQSFLTYGAACLFFMSLCDRRLAALFAATCAAAIATATVACVHWLGDAHGVWFSWLVAPRNPFVPEHFVANATALLRQPTFVAVMLLALGTLARALASQPLRTLRETPFAAHLLVAFPAALVTSAKDGAAVNSYFEFIVAAIFWTLHAAGGAACPTAWRSRSAACVAAASLAMVGELAMANPVEFCMARPQRAKAVGFHLQLAARQLAGVEFDRGKALNLTEDGWATYAIGSDAHMNDPLLYTILYETGSLSVEPLLAALKERRFDLVLLPRGDPPKWLAREPWNAVLDTLAERYQMHRVADPANDAVGVLAYMIPKQ